MDAIDTFARADSVRLSQATVHRHASALRAAAGALCRDPAACEDLVQDTFERALRHLAAGNEPVLNHRAWLVTILRNVFIDRVRAERSSTHEVEDCPAPDPDPHPPWADVTLADVRAACAAIDPDQREVFTLHYLEGLRYREIAVRLSVPENTVASRLYRARKALRYQLLAASSERPDTSVAGETSPEYRFGGSGHRAGARGRSKARGGASTVEGRSLRARPTARESGPAGGRQELAQARAARYDGDP